MGKNGTTFIAAWKFSPGQQLVWWLVDSSLRKHFDHIVFRMPGERTEEQKKLPMIVCANHSSWWDGYVAAVVQRQLGVDGYLMMEEAQLRRYPFFRWIGCFSVNRQDARSALQSLHYAANLLKGRTRRMVWLFPQGVISPNDRRPLVFFTGAAHLARLSAPVYLYPLATRIEYLGEQRPVLFISMGQPILITLEESQQRNFLKSCTKQLEELVTHELDTLHEDIVADKTTGFTLIQRGQKSTNRIFDAVLMRKQMNRP
jgi:chlorobactene lauroyltransferase